MRLTRNRHPLGSAALLSLAIFLTACGGPAATPTVPATSAAITPTTVPTATTATMATAVPPTPTLSNATTATPTTAPTAPRATTVPPTPVPSASAVSTAPPAATTVAASPAAAGTITGSAASTMTSGASATSLFAIVPNQSQAQYTVNEKFANLPFPSDAVGTTKQVQGQIVLGPDGKVADGGKIVVNIQSLTSDRIQRDSFIRMNSLDSNMYPDATFVITSAEGLNAPMSTTPIQFKLNGQMTIHGTTKPLTWDVTATMNGDTITGTATTTFKMEDFNFQPPMLAILTTSDVVKLDMNITAKKAG